MFPMPNTVVQIVNTCEAVQLVSHCPIRIVQIVHEISLVVRKPVFKVFDQVSKGAKIRNRFNQVPHLTQDTKRKVTDSQLDTTNENQEVSPFPAGDHKAINRRAQRHSKHKTEKTYKTHKSVSNQPAQLEC